MPENCELLDKCGFFNKFLGPKDELRKEWSDYICGDKQKSDQCQRKKFRKQTDNLPPDNMSPMGKLLSDNFFDSENDKLLKEEKLSEKEKMSGKCDLLEKCGFFNNFVGHEEVIKSGSVTDFCENRLNSDQCQRKKFRKQTGNPPPDNMSPLGKMLSEVFFTSEKEEALENCELIDKCGFFNSFLGNKDSLKKEWSEYICGNKQKSDNCKRKMFRNQTGNPPPDNMSPEGKSLEEAYFASDK